MKKAITVLVIGGLISSCSISKPIEPVKYLTVTKVQGIYFKVKELPDKTFAMLTDTLKVGDKLPASILKFYSHTPQPDNLSDYYENLVNGKQQN